LEFFDPSLISKDPGLAKAELPARIRGMPSIARPLVSVMVRAAGCGHGSGLQGGVGFSRALFWRVLADAGQVREEKDDE